MWLLLLFLAGAQSCSPGSFLLSSTSACAQCWPGTYSTCSGQCSGTGWPYYTVDAALQGLERGCTVCPAGQWSSTKGATACNKCAAGTFSAGVAVQGNLCAACDVGTYSAEGAGGCTSCAVGTYASAQGQSACSSSCSPGTYLYGGSCVKCTPGTYSTCSGMCYGSDSRYYYWVPNGSPYPGSGCIGCPAGQFSALFGATACTKCAAGKYSASVAAQGNSCVSCGAGTYALEGSSGCAACTGGKYASVQGQSACGTCDVGFYAPSPAGGCMGNCLAGTVMLPGYESAGCLALCFSGTYSTCVGKCVAPSLDVRCPLKCPAGTYSVEGASACTACAAGSYSPAVGAASCQACAAGTYSAASSATCQRCPAGLYSTAAGAASCLPCAAGLYNTALGAASCVPCAVGTYSATVGAASSATCLPCAAGRYSPALGAASAATCLSCAAGLYSPTLGASSAASCVQCAAGAYAASQGLSACALCPPDSFAGAAGLTQCSPCRDLTRGFGFGTYSTGYGMTACSLCPANTYDPLYFSYGLSWFNYRCAFCPEGKYAAGSGMTQCLDCSAGTIATGVGLWSCPQCLAGSYAPSTGLSFCTACAVGKSSVAGQSVCPPCLSGSFSGAVGLASCSSCVAGSYNTGPGLTACQACTAGKSSVAGQSVCPPCLAGAYASATGLSFCSSCVAGSYSSGPGLTACQACAAGKSSVAGQSVCPPCLPGSFSGAVGLSFCSSCVVGSYSSGPGLTTCQACVAGRYSAVLGSTTSANCLNCAAGSFSGADGLTSCTTCAKGSYSTGPSLSTCQACVAGSYATVLGSTTGANCLPCAAGSFGAYSGLTTCAPCAPGAYASGAGLSACAACAAGTFASAASSAQCVSCNPLGGSYCLNSSVQLNCSRLLPNLRTAAPFLLDGGVPHVGPFFRPEQSCELVACAAGYYRSSPLLASVACLPCSPGFSQAAGSAMQCTPCAAGSVASASASPECIVCGEAHQRTNAEQTRCVCDAGFNELQVGTCAACPAPSTTGALCHIYKVPSSTADACASVYPRCSCTQTTDAADAAWSNCSDACASGLDLAAAGQWLLLDNGTCTCAAGYERSRSGECVACAPGTFKASSAFCAACPVATFSATRAATACGRCPVGTFGSRVGSSACEACGALNWYNLAEGGCVPCPNHTYSTASTATACAACPIQLPLRFSGQATCSAPNSACGSLPGWFVNSGQCTACASGFYCPGGTRALCPAQLFWSAPYAYAVENCSGAAPATLSPIAACPRFTSFLNSSAKYLLQCRALGGYFGAAGEAVALCPQDFYCPPASLLPLECPAGWNSNAGASACSPFVPAPCRDNYYATWDSLWTQCLECPRGAVCKGGALVPCNATGSFWTSAAGGCVEPPWLDPPEAGAQCPNNTHAPLGSICPGGGLCGKTSFTQCRADAGFYFNLSISSDARGFLCPAQHYCPLDAVYPIPCPTGLEPTCGPGHYAPRVTEACPFPGMSAPKPNCTACPVAAPPHGRLSLPDTCVPCCDAGYFLAQDSAYAWRCEALDTSCPPGWYAKLPPEACCTHNNVECVPCPSDLKGLQLLSNASSAGGFGMHTCPYACAAGLALGST